MSGRRPRPEGLSIEDLLNQREKFKTNEPAPSGNQSIYDKLSISGKDAKDPRGPAYGPIGRPMYHEQKVGPREKEWKDTAKEWMPYFNNKATQAAAFAALTYALYYALPEDSRIKVSLQKFGQELANKAQLNLMMGDLDHLNHPYESRTGKKSSFPDKVMESISSDDGYLSKVKKLKPEKERVQHLLEAAKTVKEWFVAPVMKVVETNPQKLLEVGKTVVEGVPSYMSEGVKILGDSGVIDSVTSQVASQAPAGWIAPNKPGNEGKWGFQEIQDLIQGKGNIKGGASPSSLVAAFSEAYGGQRRKRDSEIAEALKLISDAEKAAIKKNPLIGQVINEMKNVTPEQAKTVQPFKFDLGTQQGPMERPMYDGQTVGPAEKTWGDTAWEHKGKITAGVIATALAATYYALPPQIQAGLTVANFATKWLGAAALKAVEPMKTFETLSQQLINVGKTAKELLTVAPLVPDATYAQTALYASKKLAENTAKAKALADLNKWAKSQAMSSELPEEQTFADSVKGIAIDAATAIAPAVYAYKTGGPAAEAPNPEPKGDGKKRGRGRPPGSKNKPKK